MAESKPIRVMIVDDHDVVRRGLSVFLKAFPDLQLVAEAANGKDAVRLCTEHQPDVILMDLIMPVMDGLQATRLIREQHPTARIIALTSVKDDRMVQETLRAGAIGYLSKDTSIDELGTAIRTAHAGKPAIGMDALQSLVNASAQPMAVKFDLTGRELEILSLMAKGLNNPEIASHLGVSRSTIKSHVSNLLAKMGVSSRTEAVALGVQRGLIHESV